MRSTLLVIAVLAAAGGAAARWPLPATQSAPAELEWVRTSDGWERSANLIHAPRTGARLHPLTVAAFQILATGVALTAGWRFNRS